MTSKQVRAVRDAKQAERLAAVATDTTVKGSDHHSWEVRKGQFVCGTIRLFRINESSKPYQAFGREYLAQPMRMVGNFATLNAAVCAVGGL